MMCYTLYGLSGGPLPTREPGKDVGAVGYGKVISSAATAYGDVVP